MNAGPLLCGLFLSFGLSFLVREMAKKIGALDRPSDHKQHRDPTPTMGGVAVFLAFAISLMLNGWPSKDLTTILLASLPIVFVGILDDVRGVNAVVKLGILALSTFLLVHGGIVLRLQCGPMVDGLATFLWIGFISSAFNGIDNADGSAAGVAAICSLCTFVIAWITWQHSLAILAAHLTMACLGFLVFNFPAPTATLFLGDTGSFFLGFVLAAMLILGHWGQASASSASLAIALIAFPIFDFSLILVLRGFAGKYRKLSDPITMCARDHTHHRLVAWGLRPREAVLMIYAIAALYGSVAVAMVDLRVDQVLEISGGLTLVSVALLFAFSRIGLPNDVYSHLDAKESRIPLIRLSGT
jgi:UDP-GlcNAc:undecaprenyl-phosphate GlcNAc-1-phosphate transferase